MTRHDYEQHGLEYYESKRVSKNDDGAKKTSMQPESGVNNVILQLPMNSWLVALSHSVLGFPSFFR